MSEFTIIVSWSFYWVSSFEGAGFWFLVCGVWCVVVRRLL
jgi:hypothetical protein